MAGTPVQVLRCEVVLNPQASSRERIMNVWHIATVGATPPGTAAGDFLTGINAFYQAIDGQLSNELSGSVPVMRVFNLIENKPRQPIAEPTLTALTTSSSRAQREMAVCLSYRATYVSGVTPKRRRGRIYLGPLISTALDSSTGKLAAATKTTIVGAAQTLIDFHQASALFSWVVYSPTTDVLGTGETGAFEVISGWVDDELDTQRRRSMPQPGGKTTFS